MWAPRRFRCGSPCVTAFLFSTIWCRTGGVPSAGEVESAGSEEDRTVYHPKSPPPPRIDEVPSDSTWFNLELEHGAWTLILENDAPDSEVRAVVRNICEKAGQKDPTSPATFAAQLIARKHGYERTNMWFETSQASNVFEKYLANLIESAADHPVNILEIGSFEGGSALWIAENLLLHPDSMLICIDMWAGGGADLEKLDHIDSAGSEARFRRNIARAPNGDRVTAVKGDSLLSLTGLIAAGGTAMFDAIYVDGDHAMQSVLADAVLSFRLLKVGGIVIFDDLGAFAGVEPATTAFVEAFKGVGRLEVLHREGQLVARKTAEDPWITPESVVTMGKRANHPLLSNFVPSPRRGELLKDAE